MELGGVLAELRESFVSGRTRSLSWRQSQLRAVSDILHKEEEEIFRAVKADLGKHKAEAFRDEVGASIKSLNHALKNVKGWMAPTKVSVPRVAFPTSAEVVPEPLGVVLIFSSWNFPIGLSLEPLIGAISAGNAVVLKPSELAPASSKFLANNVSKYLDNKAVKVIEGGPQVGEQLLEHKWDMIFFTGSARIGRIVMSAAAKHLTPVVLELGGKCPAIFDSLSSSRDRKMAVQRVVGGKWGPCCGQACVAIDYMLVEEKFAPIVVDLLKETIRKFYVKPDYISRIVNRQNFERLSNLLKEPSVAASIVHGGSLDSEKLTRSRTEQSCNACRFIEPTILIDPPLDAEIMTEEIFGPLLPIITLKKIEESIEFIRARPKPVVIYAFTNDEKLKSQIIAETSSGTVVFNDAIIQYLLETIPFGGVGQSGFGQYHGKFSFDVFSHSKAVARRTFLTEFSFRYPPWNERKLQLLRSLYHFNYIEFLLHFLGFK